MMEKAQINIDYKPLPTLKLFHKSNASLRCIVGPVGSGKTSAATMEIFYYIPFHLFHKYSIKKTRWLILRNTYRELADTTQKTVFEWIPSGEFRSGDQKYTVRHPLYDLEVEALFRSCDRPEDIKKFKSLEITGFWIDESIEVAEDIKLMLKNRIGRFPQKCPERYGIETTNPPDIEHPTYYQFKWVTDVPGPMPERKLKWQQLLKDHIGFWQPPNENVANLPPNYYLNLIQDYAGNEDWIDRYVKGMPGITVQGRPVYYNFKRSLHVADQSLIWNKSALFMGWDNTGNCPACVVVQVPTAGQVQVLHEYHTERMGIVDFVQTVILDRNQRYPNAEWIEWGDPAGEAKFSKKGGGFTSNAELMKEEGIMLLSSEQNWEARRESVETQLGKIVGGEPALLIDPSCTRLINGFIGGYCYPETTIPGIYQDKPLKNKFSHVHDALQYVMVMLNKNVVKEKRNKHKGRDRPGIMNWRNHVREQDRQWDGSYEEVTVHP